MKKLFIKVIVLCLTIVMLFSISKINLQANSESQLIDFSFEYEDVYLHDQVKVKIKFKTTAERMIKKKK